MPFENYAYSESRFMSESRRCVPWLNLKASNNLDFAIERTAHTKERFQHIFNSVGNLGTSERHFSPMNPE